MTWRCITCGRPIRLTPAVTIPTRGGALHMGPVCARRSGLLRPIKPRVPVDVVRGDTGQLDIFGSQGLACPVTTAHN
jgi:hypothetical protein